MGPAASHHTRCASARLSHGIQTARLLPSWAFAQPLPRLDDVHPLSVGCRQESVRVGAEGCTAADGQQVSPQTGRKRRGAEGGPRARRPHLAAPHPAAAPARPAPRAAARALTSPGGWESGARSPGEGDGRQVAGVGRPRRAQVSQGPPRGRGGGGPPELLPPGSPLRPGSRPLAPRGASCCHSNRPFSGRRPVRLSLSAPRGEPGAPGTERCGQGSGSHSTATRAPQRPSSEPSCRPAGPPSSDLPRNTPSF